MNESELTGKDESLQPQTTDPANGADRAWPDEAKILPAEFLKDETEKA